MSGVEKMDVDEDAVVDLSVRREPIRRGTGSESAVESPQDLTRMSRASESEDVVSTTEVQMRGHALTVTRTVKEFDDHYPRRNLRPRRERSYAESPDIIVLSDEEPRLNGFTNGYESDSDEGEMPPLPPIKEMSPEELIQRERLIRKLREELRNEEMKLVLLKKLRQSQQMKENIAVVTPLQQPPPSNKLSATVVPSPVSAKPLPPPQQQAPQQVPPPLMRAGHNKQSSPSGNLPPLHRGVSVNSRDHPSKYGNSSGRYDAQQSRAQNLHAPPPMLMGPHGRSNSSGSIPTNILGHMAQQSLLRGSPNMIGGRAPVTTPPNVVMGYPMGSSGDRLERSSKESHHSPAPSMPQQLLVNVESKASTMNTPLPPMPEQERSRSDDNQTPAQRQAAAKLALRKQLEKTLLQIPPPKPPPPEMHFIPNPSNAEFIYLLGLEHVVDFITRDHKIPPPPDPFQCSQCETDFTPVWKWEKSSKGEQPKRRLLSLGHHTEPRGVAGKELRVICEQCVTTNVKKALKAEHTNRLKTAFVKALQQEQEIEQRMAQSSSVSPQPEPSPKSSTPLSSRHAPTPPAPPSSSHNPSSSNQSQNSTSSSQTQRERERAEAALAAAAAQLPKLSESSKFAAAALAAAASHPAAALQAAHQQLLRLPQHQPLPAHMLPFSPLLYPYQLAMAQAAGGKGPVAAAAANLVELQRQAADLQRQYLLDMIPSRSLPQGGGSMNWKT